MSNSGQTPLPMKESLRKCWNQERCGTQQAKRALQLCQGGMVSSRQKSLSSLSSAPTTTDAAAQRDLRGKTLPSQCWQEEPAGQFLALSLVSPAEFGFVSSWVYVHDTKPTGTDVVHQERKRNLEQK